MLDKLNFEGKKGLARKPKKKTIATVIGTACAALCVPLVMQWEGLEQTGYKDIVGIPTKCYGDTNDVEVGKTYTMDECRESLNTQLIDHAEPVLACVPSLEGRTYQLAASVSLAYNIGTGAFCTSTVARRFRAGEWQAGCEAFGMWKYAGGEVVQGLVNRRNAEIELCMRGLNNG